ncbi:hypothetical protein FE257_010654 [Aspergillus nanangensis]|uniref:MT-A70 family protein n=1 Tax=Aspergillus nanangensis TaxID=2582783 RepID=A0AAD4GT42_ASPNN|nr:hypothetical protein FE257_010654 [Aspergillus nanangensis]
MDIYLVCCVEPEKKKPTSKSSQLQTTTITTTTTTTSSDSQPPYGIILKRAHTMPNSSILYHNPEDTVFLIDIPASIEIAQKLSARQISLPSRSARPAIKENRANHLLSSTPLTTPYELSSEPKTDSSRAKVLERIPHSEQVYHADIVVPFVRAGMNTISTTPQPAHVNWCLPRLIEENRSAKGETSRKKRKKPDDGRPRPGFGFPMTLEGKEYTTTTQSKAVSTPPHHDTSGDPPVILAPGANKFASLSEVTSLLVRNTSSEPSTIQIPPTAERTPEATDKGHQSTPYSDKSLFHVPPLSNFVLCQLPLSQDTLVTSTGPIPGLAQERKFNIVLLDPPWHNRSVRRSHHYKIQSYRRGDILTQRIREILRLHLYDPPTECTAGEITSVSPTQRSVAAIWITNSTKARATAYNALHGAGLRVREEWIWVKMTVNGEPITPLDGLWRKPYEILVIGERAGSPDQKEPVVRRLIAAVPDVHSRKPNLRELFERVFFASSAPMHGCTDGTELRYSALEVFARNLTAGWWACGDEALKFNEQGWWVDA